MLAFLKQAIKNSYHTGSVWPSSRALARVMTRSLRKAKGPRQILEVGPGTGPFTRYILQSLAPGDEFHIVEINEDFCDELERTQLEPFRKANPECSVTLHRCPVEESGLTLKFDFIVCGLPFNNFPLTTTRSIFRKLTDLLKPGGELAYFEYAAVRVMRSMVVNSEARAKIKRGGCPWMFNAAAIRWIPRTCDREFSARVRGATTRSLSSMVLVNEHYLKLQAGYLFPEIGRRVAEYLQENPEAKDKLIDCGVGDVTEPLPTVACEAMAHAAQELGQCKSFRGYGPPTGYEFLRKAIAEGDYRSRCIPISEQEIFISDGSKGDAGSILEILATGNRIAVADPVYPVYVDTNVMSGATGDALEGGGYEGVTYLPATRDNQFVPEPPSLDSGINLAYLCSPNNPTGSVLTRAALKRWVEWALRSDALIVFDAAYEAFIQDEDVPRSIYEIENARKCAIECRSFSKNGGFTGVRCGFTVCPHELEGRTRDGDAVSLHQLWTRRWQTRSNGVSWPVQCGAAALYSDDGKKQVQDLVDFYMTNASILRTACESRGLEAFGGQNAPYVWVACPEGLGSWQVFDLVLRQSHLVVTPGAGFGRNGEGFFRISAFNSREAVEKVAERLDALEWVACT